MKDNIVPQLSVIPTRRQFISNALQNAGIIFCAGSLAGFIQSCESNETPSGNSSNGTQIDIPLNTSGLEELSKVGGAAYINVPNQNNNKDILIIRLTETSFLAFTSICSHQGCSVQPPDTEYLNIYCACHGAEFNPESGIVVKQPTSGSATSLTSFPVKYNSVINAITITF
jgi:nitrite reductase/ring-hydroxylating ferredoxin subunit